MSGRIFSPVSPKQVPNVFLPDGCVRLLSNPSRVNGIKSEGMQVKRDAKALVSRNDHASYTVGVFRPFWTTRWSCQRGSSTVSVRTTTATRTRTLVWAGWHCARLPAAEGLARINLRDRGSLSLKSPCSQATLKTESTFCGQAMRAETTGSTAPLFQKWR